MLKLLGQFHLNSFPASRQRGRGGGGGEKVYVFGLDGCHAHIWYKPLKKFRLQNHWADCLESCYVASWDLVSLKLTYIMTLG